MEKGRKTVVYDRAMQIGGALSEAYPQLYSPQILLYCVILEIKSAQTHSTGCAAAGQGETP